jgi:hypothetical protein
MMHESAPRKEKSYMMPLVNSQAVEAIAENIDRNMQITESGIGSTRREY